MTQRRILLWLCILLAVSGTPALTQLSIGTPFGDHMVLQRGTAIAVWGWAVPHSTIDVSMDGIVAHTTADAGGKWNLELHAHAAGGPYTFRVTSGTEQISFSDVLVGEVWLCSGQSNMSFRLDQSSEASIDIPAAGNPLLRLCTVPRMRSDTLQERGSATWEVSSPASAPKFSAVAYYFGDSLARALRVPVGLIHASWGGTPAESWVPKNVLAADPMLSPILDRWKKAFEEFPRLNAEYQQKLPDILEKWRADSAASVNSGMAPSARPQAPKGPGHRDSPSGQWNAMINPLIPYSIAGVIWYQGEANASRAYQYRTLFPALIRYWRSVWRRDFPFYYVQLPNLKRKEGSGWPELREAQLMTLSVPNTGMVVTIDVGDSLNLHPTNKKPVGERLAAMALKRTYHDRTTPDTGPIYAGFSIENGRIRVHFGPECGEIVAASEPLRGFSIAGADQNFLPAEAEIDGRTVVVWNADIRHPEAVRYAWGENPQWSIVNTEGLPASPFRTDDWPETTAKRR